MAGAARIKTSVGSAAVARLAEKLAALDKKAVRRALKAGINEITKVVAKDAKSRVPKRTGQLKKSIGRKVTVKKDGSKVIGFVGPRSGFRVVINGVPVNPIKYAHLVEFGRREVVAGKAKGKATGKKVLSGDGRPLTGKAAKQAGPFRRVIFGKRVRSVPPRPFLRPAWDAISGSASGILVRHLEKAIRDFAAKGGKKGRR